MVSYIGEVLAHSVALMGLNPYCSGQWSRTYVEINTYYDENVLILIVVDNGLVLDNAVHFYFIINRS